MNVIVNKTEKPKTLPYPKLMIGKCGTIILFTSHAEGTIIQGNEVNKIGLHHNNWEVAGFEDFKGKIILEQD